MILRRGNPPAERPQDDRLPMPLGMSELVRDLAQRTGASTSTVCTSILSRALSTIHPETLEASLAPRRGVVPPVATEHR